MKYSHYFRSRAHSFRNSVFMILFGLLLIPVMTALLKIVHTSLNLVI